MTGRNSSPREKAAAQGRGHLQQRAKAPISIPTEGRESDAAARLEASSPQEVEDYFENLSPRKETRPETPLLCVLLRLESSFEVGVRTPPSSSSKQYGLVVGPWHKQGFPGMCSSKELAKQRQVKASQKQREKQHDDATFGRLERLGLDKGREEARRRTGLPGRRLAHGGLPARQAMPKGRRQKQEKLVEWFPTQVDVCVDCRRRKLVRVEHANGGPDDGKRRVPPCPEDSKGARASCDVAIHAAYGRRDVG